MLTNRRPAAIDYFDIALTAARQQAAAVVAPIAIDSLTISADTMPHHYIARAVILDLEPTAVVPALTLTLARIRAQHPHAVQTGWTACNDGLRVYFYHWSATTTSGGAR
jgi:hypothetical protein